ncbi:D-alanyl-D-alanine carboxypeptidase family protein [Hyphomicrobium sp. LHD-15]|uniref:D-alanyl-D-alanine carboxypeptidase family protein n=1 Tax=Hyphomicrobium sp. LHD-15 TaxID=3072142 RepID=UPI00280DEF0B|nr:D-alanyl-D-alanine carboxypeptidase family protein [Hyphomicrobium sp. LHD-15]MDQ8700325.1 D-alanyl-D-alanine carboxypeptidase family protein [Hyphomicrobium sp. LHD-15]
MRRLLTVAAALLGLLPAWLSAANAQQSGGFTTKAPNAILMDYDSGSIIYQKAADELVPPASMSKLMTLAVLFRALKDGKYKPEDEFPTSENAWRTGGAPSGTSAMFIPINSKTPISELIQGIVVQSGNDACITVAEGMAGNTAEFAKMMEAEARRIGMPKSTFRNPTGLHDPEHLMTARELGTLARYIIKKYPDFYPVFGQREFAYRKHKFYNRNPLLSADIGVDGMKTGHTKEAGYGMVVSSVRDGRRLIGVLMGLADEKERREETRRMLEWGAKSVSSAKLFGAGEQVGYARVWGGTDFYVPLTGEGDLEVILPKFPVNQKIRGEIVYQGPLKPPVRKGDQIAMFRVTSTVPGSPEPIAVSETPLYADNDVDEASFYWRGVDSLLYLALRLVPSHR